MADGIFIGYEIDVGLEHLFKRLEERKAATWDIKLERPDDSRPLPPIPSMEILKQKYGELAARAARCDQIVISLAGTTERIYIQGRSRVEPDDPIFLITYYKHHPARLQLLRDTLRILASEPGTTIVWEDGSRIASGSAWVERIDADPDWYWGYDPSRVPGSAFF